MYNPTADIADEDGYDRFIDEVQIPSSGSKPFDLATTLASSVVLSPSSSLSQEHKLLHERIPNTKKHVVSSKSSALDEESSVNEPQFMDPKQRQGSVISMKSPNSTIPSNNSDFDLNSNTITNNFPNSEPLLGSSEWRSPDDDNDDDYDDDDYDDDDYDDDYDDDDDDDTHSLVNSNHIGSDENNNKNDVIGNGPTPPFSLPPFSSSATTTSSSNSNSNSSKKSSSHLLLRHPDAIPTLVSLLSSPNREVHEQAMWILGSIAAGEGTASPIPNPSSSALANFANANNMSIPNSGLSTAATPLNNSSTNASTSVGNSTNNSPSSVAQAREQVLQAGAMDSILSCLEANPHKLSLQRIGSWTLSNLVDVQYQQHNSKNSNSNSHNNANNGNNSSSASGNHNPDINIKTLLPTLKRLLYSADTEVLSHTCWALSHLCDGPSSHISVVVSPAGGLVPRLVELLLHPSWRVTKPALRTIGNVVCAECVDDSSHSIEHHSSSFHNNSSNSNGNSSSSNPSGSGAGGGSMIPVDYTETILECDAVPRLKILITHGNREIQKEACWTLSNIAAGAVDQIQAVIDSGAIGPLVELASDPNADQEVRSEACWVVLNATSCGSDEQIDVLVKEGCVSVLGVLLGEQSMVMMALEGLERVLQVEEKKEMERRKNEGNSTLTISQTNSSSDATSVVSASLIEALEQHKNNAVSKRAGKIWKQHFVNCALCHQSFSKHRSSEARFCNECKCHVCKNCDCEIYHLSYQEEFWAATEERTQAKTMAKKSKKIKKKMKKKKQKKQTATNDQNESSQAAIKKKEANDLTANSRQNTEEDLAIRSRSSTVSSSYSENESANDVNQIGQSQPPIKELAMIGKKNNPSNQNVRQTVTSKGLSSTQNQFGKSDANRREVKAHEIKRIISVQGSNKSASLSQSDDDGDDDTSLRSRSNFLQEESASAKKEKDFSDIDLVHYLQQTGSIIALSRLLDQLDGNFSIFNLENSGDSLAHLKKIDGDSNMMNHENHLTAQNPRTCFIDN